MYGLCHAFLDAYRKIQKECNINTLTNISTQNEKVVQVWKNANNCINVSMNLVSALSHFIATLPLYNWSILKVNTKFMYNTTFYIHNVNWEVTWTYLRKNNAVLQGVNWLHSMNFKLTFVFFKNFFRIFSSFYL